MALPALVFLALAVFAAALLWSPHAGRAAALHLLLAVGAMPLIFGAMSHFIPVLTRTRIAASGLLSIPVLALVGGALVVGALSLPELFWGRYAGALLAVAAASALLAGAGPAGGMLDRPHPCLAWYEAAGLSRASCSPFSPAQSGAADDRCRLTSISTRSLCRDDRREPAPVLLRLSPAGPSAGRPAAA
jgi:hypothetical protein